MIKKISAVVLALVLCLSVIVVPVSALDLADGMNVAFELKWDKEYYSAGETATLSVYMKVTDDMQLGTGSILIGLNSAQISQADNTISDIKDKAVASDLWNSFWKDPASSTVSWLPSAMVSQVQAANTETENALYDHYMKIVIARNTTGGWHENATTLKYGLPGADINALADADEPIISFSYVVAADVADGTALNAAITEGSVNAKTAQTAFKYIKAPGASTTANVATTAFDVTAATATATIGEATPELTIVKDKTQINFDPDQNGYYEGTFAIRQFVEFDNLLDVFGTPAEAKDGADGTGLTEVGFVYATTDKYNKTDALAVIDDNTESGTYGAYTLDNDAYISTTAKAGSYVMGYTVKNISDKSVSLTILAYAKYEVNGKEAIATKEIAGDYSDIYSTYESKIPPVKPEA